MNSEKHIPEGFSPMPFQPGFDEKFGTFYGKNIDGKWVMGFLVMAHHINVVGSVHGGALATFADWQVVPVRRMLGITYHTATISLDMDYLASAKQGDWLEMHVNLHKETGGMLFTAAEIYGAGELIARSTGIYRKFKHIESDL